MRPTLSARERRRSAILFDSLERRVLLAIPLIYTGTANPDDYLVRTKSGAPAQFEVLLNNVVIDTQTTANVSAITFNTGDGNDVLTIDIPTIPIAFNGGAASTDHDTLNLNAGSYALSTDAVAATAHLTLNVNAATATFTATQHLDKLNIAANGLVTMPPGGILTLYAGALSIAPGGKLDLNENKIAITYTGASPFTTLQSYVFTGYSSTPDPSASGIISTSGQANNGPTMLILLDNALFLTPTWPTDSDNPIGANTIIGKSTYPGDFDFDGMVTVQDLTAIDANLGTIPPIGAGWICGDGDFDGQVTPQDYTAIDANWGAGDTTPPTVSLTSPANNATLSGTVSVSATATDAIGVGGVQFMLDGNPLGAPDSAAPYSISWNTTGLAGNHTLTAVAFDLANNTQASAPTTVLIADIIHPTIAITSPANNATFAGAVTVSANASDNVAIAGVQFYIDGNAVGAEDTTAPYTFDWNTVPYASATHTLSAVARDTSNNTTPSSSVSVRVNNGSYNLTVNPSTQFQLIDGLGVNLNTDSWNNGAVIPQLDTLVNTMGASLFRVIVEPVAGWEDTNDNADPFVANPAYYNALYSTTKFTNMWNEIKYLNDHNLPVFINVMGTIPSWMGGSTIPANEEDEFVEMITTMLDYGIHTMHLKIDSFSPLAEQDIGAPEGPSVSPTQYLTLSRKLLTRLQGLGLGSIQLIGGDTGGNISTYIQQLFSDPTVMNNVYHLAFHSYSGSNSQFVNTVNNSGYAGRDSWVTEFGGGISGGDQGIETPDEWAYDWTTATFLYQHLRDGASAAMHYDGIDAYYQHHGAVNSNGVIKWTSSTNTYSIRKRLYAIAQFTKYIRPGMRRISATTTLGNINLLAFRDSTTGQMTIVGQNTASTSASFSSASLGSNQFSSLEFYETNSTLNLARQADVPLNNGLFSFTVPAQTIFTLTTPTTPDTTPPTAPTNLTASSAGGYAPVTLNWTASTDNTFVAGYNIYRSNTSNFTPSPANLIGTSTTTPPTYTDASVPAGTWYYKTLARDPAGNLSAPSNQATSNVQADTIAPTVQITAPSNNATLTGTVSVSANASDVGAGVAGVQFYLDGQTLSAEDTTAPYSVSWNTNTAANGTHTLTATARDYAGNTTPATAVNITLNNAANPNLVAAWNFNENSGSTAIDNSGHNLNGAIANATYVTGKYGSALSFNGANAWVTIPYNSAFDFSTAFTLEAWVYPTAASNWRTVLLKQNGSDLQYALYAYGASGNPPNTYIRKTGNSYHADGGTLPLNTWSHLAATYDNTTLRLYINGAQVASTTIAGPITQGTDVLRIGGNSIWNEFFQGVIDEVRIYNRALTPSELTTDMNNPI